MGDVGSAPSTRPAHPHRSVSWRAAASAMKRYRSSSTSLQLQGVLAQGRESGTLRVVTPVVEAVHLSGAHTLRKASQPEIRLVAGVGVEGDVHAGATVAQRYGRNRGATEPNLRQVHLLHAELHDELREPGQAPVEAGDMGENVTTRGIDLLTLPAGTRLRLGAVAVVQLTGLRHPCRQLESIRPGLRAAMLDRDEEGNMHRRAGVMAVVVAGGVVRPGDAIEVELPEPPHRPLPVLN